MQLSGFSATQTRTDHLTAHAWVATHWWKYNHPYAQLLWDERDRRKGRQEWSLIVLWLINKAIDQSACSWRRTYTGSWIVGNNLLSHGVNPSKRGGRGLIVRGMGGFLHHAEMINAAVRPCHKHYDFSKCLSGYDWFFSVHVCAIMSELHVARQKCQPELEDFCPVREVRKHPCYLKNSHSYYIYSTVSYFSAHCLGKGLKPSL